MDLRLDRPEAESRGLSAGRRDQRSGNQSTSMTLNDLEIKIAGFTEFSGF